tara:strand:+ start:128 stop:1108 length:981 start_codon:yes stop_codon:yes gene_type:complete
MKSFIKLSIIYIIIFELIFQTLIFFNFKYVKIPDLFYNGYCDQKYWNFNPKTISFKNETKYHPILSYVKDDIEIPDSFQNEIIIKDDTFNKNMVSLYGSSYVNHDDFKMLLSKYNNFDFKNYALNSYGLDQIYLSYKLTAHLNQNRTIIIGFLLEDLDRSIFDKRDYEKVKFVLENDGFEMKNTPVNIDKNNPVSLDFYLFKFLKNFFNIIRNDFDPRVDECKKNYKVSLFKFYLDEITKISKIYNQKLIFITFNLEEDLNKKPTWRYNLIKDALNEKNILHIDALKILKNKSFNQENEIKSYFGLDKHNNKKSFSFIVDDLFKSL